jgi:hypothetical protein
VRRRDRVMDRIDTVTLLKSKLTKVSPFSFRRSLTPALYAKTCSKISQSPVRAALNSRVAKVSASGGRSLTDTPPAGAVAASLLDCGLSVVI